MVDNLVHSFGLQINNGVPILEFLDSKNDRELQAIEPLLIEASKQTDSRVYLEEKLSLKSVLDTPEGEFLEFEEYLQQK